MLLCNHIILFEIKVYLRQGAVGIAGLAVSVSIVILPYSYLVSLHTAGTTIHTRLFVFEVSTLDAHICPLMRNKVLFSAMTREEMLS